MPRKDDDDLEVVELELTAEDVEGHEFAPTDDGSPGRGIDRRWFVVGAIVVTVWLVVALVSQHRGAKTKASTSATTSGHPATSTTTVPLPRFAAGPLYAGATGRLAIVAGGRLVIVDAETGRVRPVPGLPPGAASVVGRNGDSLLVNVNGDSYLVDTRRDDTVPVPATIFPALDSGHWWDTDRGRAVDARNVTEGNPNPIPDGFEPVAALRAGFLVHNTTLDTFEVWHPGTAPTPLIDNPSVEIFATHPDRVAWHGPCNGSGGGRVQLCTINVTDIATGRTTFVRAPQSGDRISGRFSPDGTALAMYADNPAAASVTVADVATGKIILRAPTRSVASRVFSSEHLQPVPIDWETDGGGLFLVQGDGDALNLAIIRSGDVGARVHVPIPYLEQVLRLGTQFSASTVALAPAPARANTGLQVARVIASSTAPELDITDVDTDTVRRVILPERIPQAVAPNGSGDNRQVIALAGGFVVGTGREAFWVDDSGVISLGATEQLTAGADQNEAWISHRAATGYEIARVDGRNGALGAPITVHTLPFGIVRDGFVAIPPATFDRTAGIEVWNPTTRRTTRIDVDAAYPNLVATWGDAVAWINPELCSDVFCPLVVTDVRTRVTTATASITGGSVYNQPGGVLYGHAGSGVITAYDLHTGSETSVPGSEDAEPGLVVSSSGWVLFNTPDGGRAWHPGLTTPAEVAPVVIGDPIAAR